MLFIPKTSPQVYLTGIPALNIISPKGTGDWHSATTLGLNSIQMEYYIFGDNQPFSTNHLLGDAGIIDGTKRLKEMGYLPQEKPVWIADHPRACVDYLYINVLQTGIYGRVILDEWFPSPQDKKDVYAILDIMESNLTESEREHLKEWKKRNPVL